MTESEKKRLNELLEYGDDGDDDEEAKPVDSKV